MKERCHILPGTTLQERHRFARAIEVETGISPELVIFYGLNDQIEVQGMTEVMRNMRPSESVQHIIEQYAEQVWTEMEVIMTDLESRGTAAAFVISPGFARFQDALKK